MIKIHISKQAIQLKKDLIPIHMLGLILFPVMWCQTCDIKAFHIDKRIIMVDGKILLGHPFLRELKT